MSHKFENGFFSIKKKKHQTYRHFISEPGSHTAWATMFFVPFIYNFVYMRCLVLDACALSFHIGISNSAFWKTKQKNWKNCKSE